MNIIERTQNRIDHIRCPVIEGLPTETVHMLHKSLVKIVQMRRSIEGAQLQIDHSRHAAPVRIATGPITLEGN